MGKSCGAPPLTPSQLLSFVKKTLPSPLHVPGSQQRCGPSVRRGARAPIPPCCLSCDQGQRWYLAPNTGHLKGPAPSTDHAWVAHSGSPSPAPVGAWHREESLHPTATAVPLLPPSRTCKPVTQSSATRRPNPAPATWLAGSTRHHTGQGRKALAPALPLPRSVLCSTAKPLPRGLQKGEAGGSAASCG